MPLPPLRTVIPLCCLLLLTACSGSREQAVRLLWPAPPRQAQLEFIGTYGFTNDLPTVSIYSRLVHLLETHAPLFKRPFGIVTDHQELAYVTDVLSRTVQVIDLADGTHHLLTKEQLFKVPLGITRDSDGLLYVADAGLQTVLVLKPDGTLVKRIGGPESLGKPAYLTIDESRDRLYVSDAKLNRIAVFDLQGVLLGTIGTPGNGPGQFASPQGLAIAADGRLFVADMLNARIQSFTSEGKFLATFGEQSTDFRDFETPRDLAFGTDDNLYIIDHRKALLLTYTPTGTLLLVTGARQRTSHPLGFSTPSAIHIDDSGRLYIIDQLNARISRWQLLTPTYLAEHPVSPEELDLLRRRFSIPSPPPAN